MTTRPFVPGKGTVLPCSPSGFGKSGFGLAARAAAWMGLALLLSPCAVPGQALTWVVVPGGRRAQLPGLAPAAPGFHRLADCGITFTNTPPPGRMLENQVRYNGCGVAAGDVDGDGLADLFFCSLEGRSHLYRNLGHGRFVEITDEAGVACPGLFTSGATFADVDGDGDLDLLVNVYGGGTRLFLNDGHGHFTEKPDAGLVRRFGSTSLAVADIDGNGTLDLYVANYATSSLADHPEAKFTVRMDDGKPVVVAINGRSIETNAELKGRFVVETGKGTIKQMGELDVLYLNRGDGVFAAQSWTDGRFLDEAGKALSSPPLDWGLSAMFRDLNGDGIPDLYVCNDLFSPDRIWINDGKGHFRAASREAFRHTSRFSMGIDCADINRDGIDDLLVVDMLSRNHTQRILDVNAVEMDQSGSFGPNERPQYNENTLFLGRGDGTYAEIGALAGVDASEWSWQPVFLDVDLDGYEDLLFTTGYFRDSLNADLSADFERQKSQLRLGGRAALDLQSRMFPRHTQPKVAFRNRGDLTFEDTSDRWGFNEVAVSQGMCLVDLDNDGDLDVVINNFDAPPTIYRNEATAPRVAVRLKGLAPNTRGIGSRIVFCGGPVVQSQQMICGGRYLSSDDTERVFAAGAGPGPFSVEVFWRSGRHSLLTNVTANCVLEIDEAQAQADSPTQKSTPPRMFRDVSERLNHTHVATPFDDFARQLLLPHRLSQTGPALAWLDVNGDGWPDLLIGGGRGGVLALFQNDRQGGFVATKVPASLTGLALEQGGIVGLRSSEGAMVFVAQSNLESSGAQAVLRLDFGKTGLAMGTGLPPASTCPGPLALGDVNGDGRLALFVGGRVVPGKFPLPADSHLYQLPATGEPVIVPNTEATFKEAGLVNGAIFSDLDGDGWPDLILAVEWGPVRVFHNDHGKFHEITAELGLDKFTGWWNGVAVGDFDGDGRMDIVASNWGRNTRYERERSAPLKLYYGNWSGAEAMDVLEAGFDAGLRKYVPLRGFEPVRHALPWLQERFATFRGYGEAGVAEVLGERFAAARSLEANTLESMVFLNRGDHFEARALPAEAQFAPAFGLAVGDIDGDGIEDLFLSQNFFAVNAETPRYDGGRGLWLRGDGHGGFIPVPGQQSGVTVYGEQRGAALADFDGDGRVDLVVGQSGQATRLFHNESGRPGLRVRLVGPPGNLAAFGAQMRLRDARGAGPVREIHGGGGYWSQDDAVQVLGLRESPQELWVRWPGGKTLTYPVPAGARELTVEMAGRCTTR